MFLILKHQQIHFQMCLIPFYFFFFFFLENGFELKILRKYERINSDVRMSREILFLRTILKPKTK